MVSRVKNVILLKDRHCFCFILTGHAGRPPDCTKVYPAAVAAQEGGASNLQRRGRRRKKICFASVLIHPGHCLRSYCNIKQKVILALTCVIFESEIIFRVIYATCSLQIRT